ncbi:MAG: hypothetical protein AAB467_04485 [Patescibacteria group bacterium]
MDKSQTIPDAEPGFVYFFVKIYRNPCPQHFFMIKYFRFGMFPSMKTEKLHELLHHPL